MPGQHAIWPSGCLAIGPLVRAAGGRVRSRGKAPAVSLGSARPGPAWVRMEMQREAAGESKTVDYVRAHIDRSQARSMVMSSRGIVATEHPLASQAGATILARGGHAVDAAIAANAVMGVVSPMMNGVGGDLFAIVHERTDRAASWGECERLGTCGIVARFSAERGTDEHAAKRHSLGHDSRRRRRLVAAAGPIWTEVVRGSPVERDCGGRGGISGLGDRCG